MKSVSGINQEKKNALTQCLQLDSNWACFYKQLDWLWLLKWRSIWKEMTLGELINLPSPSETLRPGIHSLLMPRFKWILIHPPSAESKTKHHHHHHKTDLHSFRSQGLIIFQFRLSILFHVVIVLRTLASPLFHLSQKEIHPRVSMKSQNDTSSASLLTTLGWHYKMTMCSLFGRKKDEKVLSSWLQVCLHSHHTFSYNSF